MNHNVKLFLEWDNCIHPFRLFRIFLPPKRTRICNFSICRQWVANYFEVFGWIDQRLYYCCCEFMQWMTKWRYVTYHMIQFRTYPYVVLKILYPRRFLKFTGHFSLARIIATSICSRPTTAAHFSLKYNNL